MSLHDNLETIFCIIELEDIGEVIVRLNATKMNNENS